MWTNVRVERCNNGYIGYIDDVVVCKTSTYKGCYATIAALKNLPYHILADALKPN